MHTLQLFCGVFVLTLCYMRQRQMSSETAASESLSLPLDFGIVWYQSVASPAPAKQKHPLAQVR